MIDSDTLLIIGLCVIIVVALLFLAYYLGYTLGHARGFSDGFKRCAVFRRLKHQEAKWNRFSQN